EEVAECRAVVRAAAFPASDDIIAFGDQVRGAPEVEIRKRLAKVLHERLDVGAVATRRVQRVLQQYVGSSEFVDDGRVVLFVPEMREPAADDRLVVILSRHDRSPRLAIGSASLRAWSSRYAPNLAFGSLARGA